MSALSTAMFFADALSRERPLTSAEIDRLCAIKRREGPSVIRRWMPSEDAKLRRLLRTKQTAAEIAVIMGRSPDAIRSRIREIKKMKRAKKKDRASA